MAFHTLYQKPFLRKALIVLAFVGLIAVALFPFLFFNRIFTDADATLTYYHIFSFMKGSLVSGESLLWNPLLFSGFPMYLSQSAGFLDPLNLLILKIFSATFAYHLRLSIDLFLVMIFSYLAAREIGISRLASFLVGPAYLGAFNWRYLSNHVIANSLFLLPFLLFLYIPAVTRQKSFWPRALLGGVGVGWAFLSGYAQVNIYALFLLFLLTLCYSFFITRELRAAFFKKSVLFFITIALVGLVVGLPQILPSLIFTPETVRSGGLDYSVTTYKVVEPGDTVLFLLPDYLYFPYLSSGRKPLYVTPLLFLISVCVIYIVWRRRSVLDEARESGEGSPGVFRFSSVVATLSMLAIFSFIASIQWSPIFYVMNKLPVFSLFRFPYRWMYLGAWLFAVLGVIGLDALSLQKVRDAFKKVYVWLLIPTGALIVGVLAVNSMWVIDLLKYFFFKIFSSAFYGRLWFTKDLSHYQDAIARGLGAYHDFLSLGRVDFLLPFLVLVASIVTLSALFVARIGVRVFRALAFTLTLVAFFSTFIVQWPRTLSYDNLRDSQREFFGHMSAQGDESYRVFPFMLDAGFGKLVPPQYAATTEQILALNELQFTTGWPNMNFPAGVASVDGYDPFINRNLLSALEAIGSTHGGEEVTKHWSADQKIDALLKNISVVGMMNGRYIVSGAELRSPLLRLHYTGEVSRFHVPIFIYENKTVLPHTYFAKQVVMAPQKTLRSLIDDRTIDFQDRTYVDCVVCTDGLRQSQRDTLKVFKRENGFYEIHTDNHSARLLVLSENNLRGWQARLDNATSLEILRINGIYIGAVVPPGSHTVTFSYRGVLGEEALLEKIGL